MYRYQNHLIYILFISYQSSRYHPLLPEWRGSPLLSRLLSKAGVGVDDGAVAEHSRPKQRSVTRHMAVGRSLVLQATRDAVKPHAKRTNCRNTQKNTFFKHLKKKKKKKIARYKEISKIGKECHIDTSLVNIRNLLNMGYARSRFYESSQAMPTYRSYFD